MWIAILALVSLPPLIGAIWWIKSLAGNPSGSKLSRAGALLEDSSRTNIADMTEGAIVTIAGTVRHGNRRLVAPFSGQTCVAYSARAYATVPSAGRRPEHTVSASEVASCEFIVVDSSGEALVESSLTDACNIDVGVEDPASGADENIVNFLERNLVSGQSPIGREGVIAEGDCVTVRGTVSFERRDRGGPDDGSRVRVGIRPSEDLQLQIAKGRARRPHDPTR